MVCDVGLLYEFRYSSYSNLESLQCLIRHFVSRLWGLWENVVCSVSSGLMDTRWMFTSSKHGDCYHGPSSVLLFAVCIALAAWLSHASQCRPMQRELHYTIVAECCG